MFLFYSSFKFGNIVFFLSESKCSYYYFTQMKAVCYTISAKTSLCFYLSFIGSLQCFDVPLQAILILAGIVAGNVEQFKIINNVKIFG